MAEPATRRMTVAEFLRWAEGRPGRFELLDGRVVAMAPERAAHVRVKGRVFRRLAEAVENRRLPCEVYPDGMTVRVDETTAFQPDVLVDCGPPLPDDVLEAPHPVIVVEVLSPTTALVDTTRKLEGYFRITSVRHYLVVDPERRMVIHHARADDEIRTRILGEGELVLDPPGITVDVAGLFPPVGAA